MVNTVNHREGNTMCEVYSGTEPELFESQTRSIRIDGVVTSIRLEAVFWQIVQQIAEEADLSIAAFLTRIYREVIIKRGEIDNFSSLLRVACTTYLNQGTRVTLTPSRVENDFWSQQN